MLVSELMTRDPLTVAPSATLAEARRLAEAHNVLHLPVVQEGMLLGMVSEFDLWDDTFDVLRIAAGFSAFSHRATTRSVRRTMQSAHPVARPEMTVQAAAQLLLLKNRTGVAVVDERSRLVGIVTATDLRRILDTQHAAPASDSNVALAG